MSTITQHGYFVIADISGYTSFVAKTDEYSTMDSFENGKKVFTETFRFEPLPNGGTRVHDTILMHMFLPRFIRKAMLKYVLISQHHIDQAVELAARMVGEEFAKAKVE